jgi:hypothetical protein
MKDVAIVILLAILGFLLWNGRQQMSSTYTASPTGIPTDTSAPIPPEVVGTILEKFQETHPDLQPIETLFVTPQKDNIFDSRFMFLNTRNFSGVQYDIQAQIGEDGTVDILRKSETAQADPNYGFVPDKYTDWKNIQGSLDAQLKEAVSKPVPVPQFLAQTRS